MYGDRMIRYVLDATVIVDVVLSEPGSITAAEKMANGIVSTVNLSEAIQKIAERVESLERAVWAVRALPIERVPFDEELAVVAASLRAPTKRKGISFADRACLALALTRNHPALTSDSGWVGLDVGVEIESFR